MVLGANTLIWRVSTWFFALATLFVRYQTGEFRFKVMYLIISHVTDLGYDCPPAHRGGQYPTSVSIAFSARAQSEVSLSLLPPCVLSLLAIVPWNRSPHDPRPLSLRVVSSLLFGRHSHTRSIYLIYTTVTFVRSKITVRAFTPWCTVL